MTKLLRHQGLRDLTLGLALLAAGGALVLCPDVAMEAARAGLRLCGNVIVPSLFPFFVLSSLVVELGFAQYLGRALEPVMRPLFRVGGSCASAVALGFVGGYPVGARTAIQLYQQGLCTRTEAQRLLAFCNNSGPAFILGVVGTGVFASSRAGLLLYLVHALASVTVGLLFRFWPGDETGTAPAAPAPRIRTVRFSLAFTRAVRGALSSTLNICAFVVLFTVVIRLLFHTGVLSGLAGGLSALLGVERRWVESLLTGFLEISSGVTSLSGTGALAGRMSMAAFILGWAGVSVHCQVLSFLGDSGLSPRTYVLGKLLHGALSAGGMWLLAGAVLPGLEVSAALTEQVETISQLDFRRALVLSLLSAWAVWTAFAAAAAGLARKNSGKGRRSVV